MTNSSPDVPQPDDPGANGTIQAGRYYSRGIPYLPMDNKGVPAAPTPPPSEREGSSPPSREHRVPPPSRLRTWPVRIGPQPARKLAA